MGSICTDCAAIPVAKYTASPRRQSVGAIFRGILPPLNLVQIVNPADKAYGPEKVAPAQPPREQPHLHSYELPAVTVVGEKAPELREEQHVGSDGQPLWTADRRFTGTRTYVIPEGQIEFEYWLKPEIPQHGGATAFESLYEVEIGIPHRLQLDLYLIQDWEGNGGKHASGESVEMRYALADWGKILGQPCLLSRIHI